MLLKLWPIARIAALLLSAWASPALAGPPSYRMVDLGAVDPGTDTQANGVSPDGHLIVGRALGSTYEAYLWANDGTGTALPNLPGRRYAVANAVNAQGVVVGTSTTTAFGAGALPVRWAGGAVSPFDLPRGFDSGRVHALNAQGLAVGSVGSSTGERAALFGAGGTRVLDAVAPAGQFMTTAFGINDQGWVAGSGVDPRNAALNVALLHDLRTGRTRALGALPGDNGALVFGLGPAGHVVGASMLYQGAGRPFLWSPKAGMVEIPLPPKTSSGAAYAVNRRGWAVGTAGGLYAVPFLYANGTTYPLHRLLPADSGWDLHTNTSSSAQGITDGGTIIGTGVHNGQVRAYAMVPVMASVEDTAPR